MHTLKTTLPEQITSIEEAKAYLTELYNNGEVYHPEDNAADCFNLPKETTDKMNALMNQIYAIAKGTDFDPCEFILNLDPNYKID